MYWYCVSVFSNSTRLQLQVSYWTSKLNYRRHSPIIRHFSGLVGFGFSTRIQVRFFFSRKIILRTRGYFLKKENTPLLRRGRGIFVSQKLGWVACPTKRENGIFSIETFDDMSSSVEMSRRRCRYVLRITRASRSGLQHRIYSRWLSLS